MLRCKDLLNFTKDDFAISSSTSAHSGLYIHPPMVDEEPALSGHMEDPDDEDGDWDSRAEMNALISALTKLDPAKDGFAKEIWEVGRRYQNARTAEMHGQATEYRTMGSRNGGHDCP